MSTACGRPKGEGVQSYVDVHGQRRRGQKPDFLVDIING